MKRWGVFLVALAIGAANAIIFKVFEYIVNHGQELVWNDWFDTDTTRWLVVPLAIILSLLLSVIIRTLREPRWIKPELQLEIEDNNKPSVGAIGKTLTIGASGLVAGASLGPEMPLTHSSIGIGAWVRHKLGYDKNIGSVLVEASVGSLLVAFLGSLMLVLLPLLIVYQKTKKLTITATTTIALAGIGAYGTLWLLDHHVHGYGVIPVSYSATVSDYIGAIVTGLLISIVALALVRLIRRFAEYTHRVDREWPWYISASLFGLVLGGLYLLGGQAVQFSGTAGIGIVLSNPGQYGTWALLGLVIVKLAATAWSKSTGYRGGLYFPSIFAGVCMGLFVQSIAGSLTGPGVTVGAIAAVFMALSIPDKTHLTRQEYLRAAIIALLFMAALLPVQLIPLIVVAIVATFVGNKQLVRLFPGRASHPTT